MKKKVEQQLKLYGETLQGKLDESEKIRNEFLESSKKMLNVRFIFLNFLKLTKDNFFIRTSKEIIMSLSKSCKKSLTTIQISRKS
jgi:hypothetical protein